LSPTFGAEVRRRAGEAVEGVRDLPRRARRRARALIVASLDRVFDEPFDIPDAEAFERAFTSLPPGTITTAQSISAFVVAVTPFTRRMWRMARVTGSGVSRVPGPTGRATRYALIALPVGVQLAHATRRGVRELQVLASFVIVRLRAAGVTPEHALVRGLTVSLAIDPARRPDPTIPPGRAAASLGRLWAARAIGRDDTRAVSARARAQREALDRLDLASFAAR
jgi:hypothetical protein